MATPESVVIVGAGMAGANAAFTLRKLGYDGRVVLVGAEDSIAYERPPLSKDYLRGESPIEKAYVKPASDYDEQRIEFLRGRTAHALNVAEKRVDLDDGSSLPYGALVLSTGSEPRRLEVAGAELPNVRYLRTIADSDGIRAAAEKAESVAVVGGGWIGSEVAASLRQLGHSVTLVSRTARPLEKVLGTEIAEVYRQLHVERGTRIATGSVSSIDPGFVNLDDGTRLPADLVVVGVGAVPRTALAKNAGLKMRDRAVEVDELLATSAPDVYAIGDIASAWHPRLGRPVRIEHWDNAKQQGRAVAATILGQGRPYVRTPYFYSDQFDLGMEYRGFAPTWDEVVVRGDVAARSFDAFWLADGRVIAGMNANRWDDGDELLAIVEAGAVVDPVRLGDPNVKLAEAA